MWCMWVAALCFHPSARTSLVLMLMMSSSLSARSMKLMKTMFSRFQCPHASTRQLGRCSGCG
eukprot:5948057-Amphidinium_carterae.1